MPSWLPYLFLGAAIIGLVQLFMSQAFINTGILSRAATDGTRLSLSVAYLTSAVSAVKPGLDRRHSPLAQRCLSHISRFHCRWPQRLPCGSTPEDGSSISLLGSTDNANIHDLSALRLFLHRKWWRSSPLASCAGDRGSLDARRQLRHVLVTTWGVNENWLCSRWTGVITYKSVVDASRCVGNRPAFNRGSRRLALAAAVYASKRRLGGVSDKRKG